MAAGVRLTDAEVRAALAAARWQPPTDWVYVNAGTPIPGTCGVCGYTAPTGKGPRASTLRRGSRACDRCGRRAQGRTRHHINEDTIRTELASARWIPADGWTYQGSQVPIPGRCANCGYIGGPTLNNVRRRGGACRPCGIASFGAARATRHYPKVLAALAAARWIPDDGWTYRNTMTPIPGTCGVCGYTGPGPTASNLRRRGHACIACSYVQRDGTLRFDEPARVYLVAHRDLNACKVGITNGKNDARLNEYAWRGWQVVDIRPFDTVADALVEEQRILAGWRDAGFPPYLTQADMPMGGWTETAQITALEHWQFAA